MDTQQVLELLLARMETAQVQMLDRLEANRKEDMERMEARPALGSTQPRFQ
jgi:hypothetical protein